LLSQSSISLKLSSIYITCICTECYYFNERDTKDRDRDTKDSKDTKDKDRDRDTKDSKDTKDKDRDRDTKDSKDTKDKDRDRDTKDKDTSDSDFLVYQPTLLITPPNRDNLNFS
jgi:hypothetical protein